MGAILVIALKDLRQRLRDRSAILIGVIAPLGLAFIFAQVIPDPAAGDLDFTIGLTDLDGGVASRPLVVEVLPAVEAGGPITIEPYPDEEAARTAVEEDAADAAIVIPAGFSADVTGPPPPGCGDAGECVAAEITVIAHVDRPVSRDVATAISESYTAALTTSRVAGGAAVELGIDPVPATQTAILGEATMTLTSGQASDKQLDVPTYLSAGMAIFFLFFTIQFGVLSLLEEKANGTLPRLLAAPIRWWHVVAGKATSSFVVGLLAMVTLIVASTLLIGASWGDPLGVTMLVVAAVLSALGIMAFIATIATTAEQAANVQAIVAVVLGLLGGTFFPVSQGPEALLALSLLTPHAWFLRGLGSLADGSGAAAALPATLALLVFTAVAVALSMIRIRRAVQP